MPRLQKLKQQAHWLIKRSLELFYRPLVVRYLHSDRRYRYGGVDLIVRTGVFHPGLFFSTKILFRYLEEQDLEAKRFLEIGAGTGLLSIRAAQRGADVVALDISRRAIANLIDNAERNHVSIEVVESNMFSRLSKQLFDVVVVNPPYYPGNPENESEYAWYCGANFEFFDSLFSGLHAYIDDRSLVIMNLSQDCKIETILSLAAQRGLHFELAHQERVLWEKNYVYRLRQGTAQ